MAFRKATKAQSLLRLAMFGSAGSGKTYSSIAVGSGIASAIGSRVAVIDTERGSASKYADRFDFDVCEVDQPRIDAYVAALQDAARGGYKVVVVDSLTHGWQELLEEVDRIASRMGGNTWAAWSKATPQQRRLVDAILRYPGHVLCTMRAKTAWETGTDKRGKAAPVKIGLAPEQRSGLEYEFDFLGSLDSDHVLKVEKDRTGKYQDRWIELPGVDFGRELVAWLNEGDAPPRLPAARPPAEDRVPAANAPRSQLPANAQADESGHPARNGDGPGDPTARALSPDWDFYAESRLRAFGDRCRAKGIEPPEVHPLRFLNGVITRAIDAGIVDGRAILKPARPGEEPKRSGAKCRDAWAFMAREYPTDAERIVADYLREKAEGELVRSTEGGNDEP